MTSALMESTLISMTNLSEAAITALTNAVGYHIGSELRSEVTPATRLELTEAKLIGPRGGLTIKGSVKAEQLKAVELDRMFG